MACGESEAAVSDIIHLFIIIIISIGSDHLQVFWRLHAINNAIVKPKQAHYQPPTWSNGAAAIYLPEYCEIEIHGFRCTTGAGVIFTDVVVLQ